MIIAILTALFWSMGGNALSEWLNKKFNTHLHFDSLWRKIGVPATIGIGIFVKDISWISLLQGALAFGISFGAIALSGYGENSPIYRFFRSLTNNDGWLTDFLTRTTNGLLWTI